MNRLSRSFLVPALAVLVWLTQPAPVIAQAPMESLCDTALSDCRAALLTLITKETQGIDVGFWYMADARYSNELVKKHQAGVPVRVLMDDRSMESKPGGAPIIQQLKDAGIPMRKKSSGGIFHWKMMLFHGQDRVEFSKANFSGESFVPISVGSNWTDEAVYITGDARLVDSFRRKFDDLWASTSGYANYANVTSLSRRYDDPATTTIEPSIHSSMNFTPGQDFANRSVARYNAETLGIDVLVFRATDPRHTDAMIAAVKRGIPVRLIHEPQQYRDPRYWQHARNVDHMYMNGVQIRSRQHTGLLHEAAVILHGLGEVIFGSSNWSVASANSQAEHNFFYTPGLNKRMDSGGETFYQWFAEQFMRKWNDDTAFPAFRPLPPTAPVYSAPVNGGAGLPLSATLKWDGGNWAMRYDIYFGTTPNPPLLVQDVAVGSAATGVIENYVVENLAPGTTYYWRIVGKTLANLTASGPTWSFTTAAGSGGDPGSATDVVLYPGKATVKAGTWQVVSDGTAAGGSRMHQPDRGAAKVSSAAASPANYFEMAFDVQAGVAYQLWIRGKADNDSWTNDSVFVQFTNSVDGSGLPAWRIGSTGAIWIGIEECSGCGLQGWGWHDNGYGVGVRGAPVYFSTSGTQRIRVQQREDGISIDQIVLSPVNYRTVAPGATKNDNTILAEAGGGSGEPPPSGGVDEVVIHAASFGTVSGTWAKESDTTAASGTRLRNPDAGAPKLSSALSSPSNYVEATFTADAGKAYHIWLRMKADNNYYANDSVFVQFSGSTTSSGSSAYRIGTTSALTVSLEEGSGAGVSGWGWNDNAYGSLGTPIYFASSGTQRIRIQLREDGFAFDQIVLSAARYLTSSPGSFKNDTRILPEANVTTSSTSTGINEVVMHASTVSTIVGQWAKVSDSTAAGGVRLRNADAGAAKITSPLAAPVSYFEKRFSADAGKAYHLWLRMKAENDYYANDSVYVQFSGSRNATGSNAWRIGTTSALSVMLEEGNGAGVHGWGWNDDGYGTLGVPIYFAASGAQTMRVQVREDGVSIDQMVLSAAAYDNSSPGAFKNDSRILAATVGAD